MKNISNHLFTYFKILYTRFFKRPTAVDLFGGCGGLTLGLKQAGFKVLATVDNDPVAVETYKVNHPEVKVWEEDIRTLSARKVMDELGINAGELDLLVGCPPCQGFSTIRTLNGGREIKDKRNDLVLEFIRFVMVLQPKAVMMENVPGLAQDGRFAIFILTLSKLGYEGDYQILNAADYRVPQRRRRLIYLAGRGFQIPFGHADPKKRTVHDAIGGLPKAGESGDPVHDFPERRTKKVLDLIKKIPKNGGGRTDLPQEDQLDCHKKCNGFKDIYGRMAWDELSPTITSGCFNPSKGRFLHPEEDRAITMREAALLQGFPIRYEFPNTNNKAKIALLIGNALPPPFIKIHALSIRKSVGVYT